MKKKNVLKLIFVLLIFTILFGCKKNSDDFSEDENLTSYESDENGDIFSISGRYIKSIDNKSFIMIDNMTPSIITNFYEFDFDYNNEFGIGDLIEIRTNGVMETYPAKVEAFDIKILSKGEFDDINYEVLSDLSNLGYDFSYYDFYEDEDGKYVCDGIKYDDIKKVREVNVNKNKRWYFVILTNNLNISFDEVNKIYLDKTEKEHEKDIKILWMNVEDYILEDDDKDSTVLIVSFKNHLDIESFCYEYNVELIYDYKNFNKIAVKTYDENVDELIKNILKYKNVIACEKDKTLTIY